MPDLRHLLHGEADALAAEARILDSTVGHGVDAEGGHVTQDAAADLALSTNTKSGSGTWAAESGGTLKVEKEVSGDATWELIDDEDSDIWFTTGGTSMSLDGAL